MLQTTIQNRVATLTLSAPPVNALSEALVTQISNALDTLLESNDWTVLHIRSDQAAFCAGADLKGMLAYLRQVDGPDRAFSYVASLQRLYTRIENLPRVTLAEMGGAALGGGLELALACDLRISATEARLGLPEIGLGLIPGAGGTQRLTRLVGRGIATRLVLGGEAVDGASAERLGLVQWACPRSELAERAAEIAARFAALPPAALASGKLCISSAEIPGKGGYLDELEFVRSLLSSDDTRQRVQTFLSKNHK